MPVKARAKPAASPPDALDPYEPLRIIRSVGDAFHRYTWKRNRAYGQADPDEGEFRCGEANDKHFYRLHTLRPQWVQAAHRVGCPPREARRAFDQLMDAFFAVRKEFHGLTKHWENWRDNSYNPDHSTLAGHLGLKLTASEMEVKEAAEANNAPIRDRVHKMIESAIAAAIPIAEDICQTTPLLAAGEEGKEPREGDHAPDPSSLGKAFLIEQHQVSKKPSVTQLAHVMGVKRQQLYANKAFEGVRETANMLFGLFGNKEKWQGARGSKSKQGDMEAWEED